MKKYEEVLQSVLLGTQEDFKSNPIVARVLKLKGDIESSTDLDSTQLSYQMEELSVIVINLGMLAAQKTAEANTSYFYRKLAYSSTYRGIRASLDGRVKDAEEDAQLAIEDDLIREVKNQYQADLYKNLYEDCSRLVSTRQTRLKYIHNEIMSNQNKL